MGRFSSVDFIAAAVDAGVEAYRLWSTIKRHDINPGDPGAFHSASQHPCSSFSSHPPALVRTPQKGHAGILFFALHEKDRAQLSPISINHEFVHICEWDFDLNRPSVLSGREVILEIVALSEAAPHRIPIAVPPSHAHLHNLHRNFLQSLQFQNPLKKRLWKIPGAAGAENSKSGIYKYLMVFPGGW